MPSGSDWPTGARLLAAVLVAGALHELLVGDGFELSGVVVSAGLLLVGLGLVELAGHLWPVRPEAHADRHRQPRV